MSFANERNKNVITINIDIIYLKEIVFDKLIPVMFKIFILFKSKSSFNI